MSEKVGWLKRVRRKILVGTLSVLLVLAMVFGLSVVKGPVPTAASHS